MHVKDLVVHVGGLQNNTTCTQSVKVSKMLDITWKRNMSTVLEISRTAIALTLECLRQATMATSWTRTFHQALQLRSPPTQCLTAASTTSCPGVEPSPASSLTVPLKTSAGDWKLWMSSWESLVTWWVGQADWHGHSPLGSLICSWKTMQCSTCYLFVWGRSYLFSHLSDWTIAPCFPTEQLHLSCWLNNCTFRSDWMVAPFRLNNYTFLSDWTIAPFFLTEWLHLSDLTITPFFQTEQLHLSFWLDNCTFFCTINCTSLPTE